MKKDPGVARNEHSYVRQWEQRRHQLYQQCLRMMGGHHADAEDALSLAVIKLLSSGADLDEIKDVDAWLGRVARNACLDIYRARKRRNELSLTWDDWNHPQHVESALLDHAGPESHLVHREVAELAGRMIRTLPEDLRVPLLLRIEDDLSYQDIAARLSLTEGNVRKRVQIARRMIARGVTRAARRPRPVSGGPAVRAKADPNASERVEIPTSEALYPIAIEAASGARHHVWLALDSALARFTPCRYRRYVRYVDAHPAGWKMRLELADMLLQAGRLDEAAEHYRAVLTCRRHLWRARWRLMLCLRTASRLDELTRVLAEMQIDPAAGPATRAHLRGLHELAVGNSAGAETAFIQAADLEPGNGAHWTALASLRHAAGRPAEAWQALRQALVASPRDIQTLILAHDVARLLDNTSERAEILSLARATHDNCVAVQMRVLEHRCQLGQLDHDTAAMVRGMLRAHPELAEAHGCAARWWRAHGQGNEALHVMRRFVQSSPTDITGWRLLAREERESGVLRKAEQITIQARVCDPELTSAFAWTAQAS